MKMQSEIVTMQMIRNLTTDVIHAVVPKSINEDEIITLKPLAILVIPLKENNITLAELPSIQGLLLNQKITLNYADVDMVDKRVSKFEFVMGE